MTAKKSELPDNPRKRKRIVPTRAAGTPAIDAVDELFAAAFANRSSDNQVTIEEINTTGITDTTNTTGITTTTGTTNTFEKFPISPNRDFTKVPNSVARDVLAKGLFKGKSKQIYDYLWSVSRGAIRPSRTIKKTHKEIMKGAGIGSRNTAISGLKYLQSIGLIGFDSAVGESGGNTYQIHSPEELGYIGITNTTNTTGITGITTLSQKVVIPVIPESGYTGTTQTTENKDRLDASKTSFKDANTNDDETFLGFIEKFQELSREISGKKITKRESGNLVKLADLLILEFRIAARRTENVSSIPAFLTEVLRRKLREMPATPKAIRFRDDKTESSESDNYEIKHLDKNKRETALNQLREFAEDEFFDDFKKWYTDEDWKWLIEQLKK